MSNAEYVYTKFVSPALSTIVRSKSGFSRKDRLCVILRYSFGIREEQIPEQARKDWRRIITVSSRPVPPNLSWKKPTEARVHGLSSAQTLTILCSFWNLTRVVVQELSK